MAGIPIGMDYTAVILLGAAQDVDLDLLTEVLPEFESAVIAALSGEDDGGDDPQEE